MYPEDRVLVGVMPDPHDFEIACDQHWYRVPVKHAPAGIHAEYMAFYFTAKFPSDLRWAVHFYARRTGHELVRRATLFPDQPEHPRAQEMYYKIQLGVMRKKQPPIHSLRWRRITFIQTTWNRFVKAEEINDLFRSDDDLVDRIYRSLKERGIYAERSVEVSGGNNKQVIDLVIPCNKGAVLLVLKEGQHPQAIKLGGDESKDLMRIEAAIVERGGLTPLDTLPKWSHQSVEQP